MKNKKIVGKTFKQLTKCYKKSRISKRFSRGLFYHEPVTVVKLGKINPLDPYGIGRTKTRYYIMAQNGVQILGGGVTYYQLRKHFKEI